MTQQDLAETFGSLHIPGTPLVLYNIWDAGSARAVAKAGATALATGSWSLAHAQGYDDAEDMPLDFALSILARIAATSDLPVSFDFEAGYAAGIETLAGNFRRVIEAGAVGVNFEDRIIGGDGLQSVEAQAERITTLREVADETGVPVFINARTDVFFQGAAPDTHGELMGEANARAVAYAEAGADGIFVPGLISAPLIETFCAAAPLPVNIMQIGQAPDIAVLATLGVARVSHGPAPYRDTMRGLTKAAESVLTRPAPMPQT